MIKIKDKNMDPETTGVHKARKVTFVFCLRPKSSNCKRQNQVTYKK